MFVKYLNKMPVIEINQIGNIHPRNENQQQARVYDTNGVAPTIRAGESEGRYLILIIKKDMEKENLNLPKELIGKEFRIRKLTPRECFRLMDVDDADIDKIQASGISNSGQYKLAGNSIVVNVLYHIFRKLLIETEQDVSEGEQMTLF